jgi:hypothetical protein
MGLFSSKASKSWSQQNHDSAKTANDKAYKRGDISKKTHADNQRKLRKYARDEDLNCY